MNENERKHKIVEKIEGLKKFLEERKSDQQKEMEMRIILAGMLIDDAQGISEILKVEDKKVNKDNE